MYHLSSIGFFHGWLCYKSPTQVSFFHGTSLRITIHNTIKYSIRNTLLTCCIFLQSKPSFLTSI